MGEFSLSHLLILGLILMVFFGPSRLPGLGKSLGEAIRGFKDGLNDDTSAQDPNNRIEAPRAANDSVTPQGTTEKDSTREPNKS